MIRDSKQLQIGKAGEYLVCADLIMKGFIAFPSEQGLPRPRNQPRRIG